MRLHFILSVFNNAPKFMLNNFYHPKNGRVLHHSSFIASKYTKHRREYILIIFIAVCIVCDALYAESHGFTRFDALTNFFSFVFWAFRFNHGKANCLQISLWIKTYLGYVFPCVISKGGWVSNLQSLSPADLNVFGKFSERLEFRA